MRSERIARVLRVRKLQEQVALAGLGRARLGAGEAARTLSAQTEAYATTPAPPVTTTELWLASRAAVHAQAAAVRAAQASVVAADADEAQARTTWQEATRRLAMVDRLAELARVEEAAVQARHDQKVADDTTAARRAHLATVRP